MAGGSEVDIEVRCRRGRVVDENGGKGKEEGGGERKGESENE